MKKSELITSLSLKTGLPKSAVEKTLDALGEATIEALRNGDNVPLQGIGKIVAVKRAERPGRNPKTGEPVTIAASVSAKLAMNETGKAALN